MPGVLWLAVDLHVGLVTALSLGLVPFLGGDAVKMALAAGLLPAALAGHRDAAPAGPDPPAGGLAAEHCQACHPGHRAFWST